MKTTRLRRTAKPKRVRHDRVRPGVSAVELLLLRVETLAPLEGFLLRLDSRRRGFGPAVASKMLEDPTVVQRTDWSNHVLTPDTLHIPDGGALSKRDLRESAEKFSPVALTLHEPNACGGKVFLPAAGRCESRVSAMHRGREIVPMRSAGQAFRSVTA